MKRILNCIKDVFDPRDHTVAPSVARVAVRVSFRSKVAYIKDQGSAGSCTAHAGTAMMELLYRMQPSQLTKHVDVTTLRFSPLFLYGQERIKEGSFNSDNGADSRTIFRVLSQIGCCLESEDPYIDRNIFVVPSTEDLSSAAKYKIGAYHRILDVETAKTVLQSGYSFTIGIPLFQQFESDEASNGGLIRIPGAQDSAIGGHEMHVIGCDDAKQVFGCTGAFEVQNSWGSEWGDGGFCWIPYEYFDAIGDTWDAWISHFGKPWGKRA